MDEKKTLMAVLDILEKCGDLYQEAENLSSRIENLETTIHRLFDELNPLNSSWVDCDTWSTFKQQIIDYCEGAK